MELGTVTLYAIIALVINGVAIWIREWRKHRTWNKNGQELTDIKASMVSFTYKLDTISEHVGEVNVKMAEVKTSVNAQGKTCNKTVTRFDKAFGDQNRELIALAKESGRRR